MANPEPNDSATDSAPEQPQNTAPPARPASRQVVEQRNVEIEKNFNFKRPNYIPKESDSEKSSSNEE